MRRRRWRTAMLWGGCTLCALIAAAFVASGWWQVTFYTSRSSWMGVSCGGFEVCTGAWYLNPPGRATMVRHDDTLAGWNFWMRRSSKPPGAMYTAVPLYAPPLGIAIPTLLVWRFVPKFPGGHCRRCGYNLKGLTGARCPECGTEFSIGDDT